MGDEIVGWSFRECYGLNWFAPDPEGSFRRNQAWHELIALGFEDCCCGEHDIGHWRFLRDQVVRPFYLEGRRGIGHLL